MTNCYFDSCENICGWGIENAASNMSGFFVFQDTVLLQLFLYHKKYAIGHNGILFMIKKKLQKDNTKVEDGWMDGCCFTLHSVILVVAVHSPPK